jgi:hypothetical protein
MYKHYESSITTFGRGGKSSLMSESAVEIQINIHLARENLTTRRMHSLLDLTYGNPSQILYEVEFAPLHPG